MWRYKICVCFTRTFKIAEAEPPPDVKEYFKKYSECGTHMTAEQLLRFLVDVQRESGATLSDAEGIVQQILRRRHHIVANLGRNALTLEDFHHYLFSVDLNSPIHNQVHHDMNAPLSHYFIYTGHNSYLTGNQLSSDCSDVPIIKALQRGVRVIELDIWPNSAKDDVQVLHGRTLTPPVELVRCLKSIKEHAFTASPYPVIITLEDHLTPDLQAKVAKMITQTFGDMLFYPAASDYLKEFPSPEELKYHIIISTKPPKEFLEAAKDVKEKQDIVTNEKYSDEDVSCKEQSILDQECDDKVQSILDQEFDDKNDSDISEGDNFDKKLIPPTEYRRLISIHAGKPKGGLKEALKVEVDKVRRLSLSEQALETAAESHGMDVVRFTQRNILRIYPKGTRFNSSNYNPHIGWMHGAQMVAFNMQGYGKSLWLMHGMFKANGGCGYVKKPDLLTKNGPENHVFDPKAELSIKTCLKVKVYMGDGWRFDFKPTHFDSYSPPDFYTRVGIAGVPADKSMKRTKIKEDNWTPVWNEEFVFPLTAPELALLRIEVHEYDISEKDDFAGQTCIPVSELKPGIRAVPICDRKGEKFDSVKLLMGFEFV